MKNVKIKTINAQELFSNLFIILVASLTLIRGIEWIVTDYQYLTNVSNIYLAIEDYINLQTFGWLLVISSVNLVCATLSKKIEIYYFLAMGGFVGAISQLFYAMISIDHAQLFSTYYTALVLAFAQFILFFIGVVGIWKKVNTN